jgi:hypothetical protein
MTTISDHDGVIELRERLTWGRRVLFILISLFPLIAPYQLLIKPSWDSYFNFFFIISLMISLGAFFVSGFLLFISLAGLSTRLIFDPTTQTFTYIHEAPIVPFRRDLIAFDEITRIEVEKHDWTDGEPSYSLQVHIKDDRTYKSASFSTQEQARSAQERIAELLEH